MARFEGSYIGGAADTASAMAMAMKETPLTRLQEAVSLLDKAHARVAQVASKLIGERASEDNPANSSVPDRPGILGSIEDLAAKVSYLAEDISADISRIERRL